MPTQLTHPETQLIDLLPPLEAVEPFTVEDVQGLGDLFGSFRTTAMTKTLLGRRPGTVPGVPEAWFIACCCCSCCCA